MPRLDLRVQTLRPEVPWWPDADSLGDRLTDLVKRNLSRGAPTTAIVVRREEVSLVPLRPFAEARMPIRAVLGGLARWNLDAEPPEAVGVIGRVRWRTRRDKAWNELALVFLEWPDGSWWEWRGLLDASGELVETSEGVARAVDGLARPSGLGGWWTFARRNKPTLHFSKTRPTVDEGGASKPIVH